MGVGTHQGVRIGHRHIVNFFGHDHTPQIFQVHLVADTGVGGYDVEIIKAFLGPLQQGIAFCVAFIFFGDILGYGIGGAKIIDLHGVIGNQIHGDQRIDFLRIATQVFDGIAHGRKIDNRRNTCKILHQHSRRVVRNFHRRFIALLPARDVFQIFVKHNPAVQLS